MYIVIILHKYCMIAYVNYFEPVASAKIFEHSLVGTGQRCAESCPKIIRQLWGIL